jgi:hypothetical protein
MEKFYNSLDGSITAEMAAEDLDNDVEEVFQKELSQTIAGMDGNLDTSVIQDTIDKLDGIVSTREKTTIPIAPRQTTQCEETTHLTQDVIVNPSKVTSSKKVNDTAQQSVTTDNDGEEEFVLTRKKGICFLKAMFLYIYSKQTHKCHQ